MLAAGRHATMALLMTLCSCAEMVRNDALDLKVAAQQSATQAVADKAAMTCLALHGHLLQG